MPPQTPRSYKRRSKSQWVIDEDGDDEERAKTTSKKPRTSRGYSIEERALSTPRRLADRSDDAPSWRNVKYRAPYTERWINEDTPLWWYDQFLVVSVLNDYYQRADGTFVYDVEFKNGYYSKKKPVELKYILLAHGLPVLINFHKTSKEFGVPLEAEQEAVDTLSTPRQSRRSKYANEAADTPTRKSVRSSRASQSVTEDAYMEISDDDASDETFAGSTTRSLFKKQGIDISRSTKSMGSDIPGGTWSKKKETLLEAMCDDDDTVDLETLAVAMNMSAAAVLQKLVSSYSVYAKSRQ